MSTPVIKLLVISNLETQKKLRDSLFNQFNTIMADEEVDLVDRWNFFMEHCDEVLPLGTWINNFPDDVRGYIRNHRDPIRYQTVKYSTLFCDDWYSQDAISDNEEDWIESVTNFVNENRELVTNIIKSGISGSVWDW